MWDRLCCEVILIQKFRINERHNLIPDVRIVFDLVVRFIENSGEPVVVVAADVLVPVSHVKVTQNLRSLGVLGDYERPPWC